MANLPISRPKNSGGKVREPPGGCQGDPPAVAKPGLGVANRLLHGPVRPEPALAPSSTSPPPPVRCRGPRERVRESGSTRRRRGRVAVRRGPPPRRPPAGPASRYATARLRRSRRGDPAPARRAPSMCHDGLVVTAGGQVGRRQSGEGLGVGGRDRETFLELPDRLVPVALLGRDHAEVVSHRHLEVGGDAQDLAVLVARLLHPPRLREGVSEVQVHARIGDSPAGGPRGTRRWRDPGGPVARRGPPG